MSVGKYQNQFYSKLIYVCRDWLMNRSSAMNNGIPILQVIAAVHSTTIVYIAKPLESFFRRPDSANRNNQFKHTFISASSVSSTSNQDCIRRFATFR